MDLRVFLSSTFEDLKDVRQRVRQHLGVIPAEVVGMEFFGSDESKPLAFSLEEVRKTNLFIGIYAERYGTIDPASGLSITELEYHEAKSLLDAGKLSALLVYILAVNAKWPVNLVERDAQKTELLLALKSMLTKNHTVAYFEDAEGLSLGVLKDVLRKIGVSAATVFKPRTSAALPPLSSARVIGMEHYTERDSTHFRGRETAIVDLLKLIDTHPLTLLIGDSGIGKTSLLQAGFIPSLKKDGWAIASCRPLENPDLFIPQQVWQQLMESPFPDGTSLSTALGIIATAHASRRVAIVIDQFEDAIPNLGRATTIHLLEALTRAHCTPIPNLRFLLAYRGDADPKVGRYWQRVSGSASGLPRYYLEPLSSEAAKGVLWEVMAQFLPSGKMAETSSLIETIVTDLTREMSNGYGERVYPPFLQMVAETLVRVCNDRSVSLSGELYRSLNCSHEIIGRYLVNQLRFLDQSQGEARTLLLALASKRGRLRKSFDELVKETGLSLATAESVLQQLTGLRLVRRQEDLWEVVHDYLAARITEELSDPEDQEARTFRNVLIAKTMVFEKTKGFLTEEEQLGLYAHRKRIVCSQDEDKLLFVSSLTGSGPCAYYLTNVPPERVLEWAKSEAADLDWETALNAHRYLLRHGVKLELPVLAKVFSDYKLQAELAAAISRSAAREDLHLLFTLRNKNAEQVAQAARKALEQFLTISDEAILKKMLRSGKQEDLRIACSVFSAAADKSKRGEYRAELGSRSLLRRAAAACALAAVGSTKDTKLLLAELRKAKRGDASIWAYAIAHWAHKTRTRTVLRRVLEARKRAVALGALASIETGRAGLAIGHLLKLYPRFPRETSSAILRTVCDSDLGGLQKFAKGVSLSPSARDILVALVKVGGPAEVQFVLNLIASCKEVVEFWNVPILAAALANSADRSMLPELSRLADNEEFWRYVGRERGKNPLPVRRHENLYLFKRLVGVCLAHICTESEWPLLRRLVFHDYRIVQMAAAHRISEFATAHHLDALISDGRALASDLDSDAIDAICAVDEAVYTASH